MKTLAILTILVTFQSFAGSLKLLEITPSEHFGYDHAEEEFIFDKKTQLVGVKVTLVPELFSERMPQVYEIAIPQLTLDKSGALNLNTKDGVVQCAQVVIKRNGKFSDKIKETNLCKFKNTYKEVVRREGIRDIKYEILEVSLNF
jgi:hypothetical protein